MGSKFMGIDGDGNEITYPAQLSNVHTSFSLRIG